MRAVKGVAPVVFGSDTAVSSNIHKDYTLVACSQLTNNGIIGIQQCKVGIVVAGNQGERKDLCIGVQLTGFIQGGDISLLKGFCCYTANIVVRTHKEEYLIRCGAIQAAGIGCQIFHAHIACIGSHTGAAGFCQLVAAAGIVDQQVHIVLGHHLAPIGFI